MSRDRPSSFSPRIESVRDLRLDSQDGQYLKFSFKYLDQTQPKGSPESLAFWEKSKYLLDLVTKLYELSKLTLQEAKKQKIITVYDNFPPDSDFVHPPSVAQSVKWAVIRSIGHQ